MEEENKKTVKKEKKNAEVEKLKEENKVLNDKLLRTLAEMQNMKRRYEEELSKAYKYDGEEFIKKSLSVVDNFERAISQDSEVLDDTLSKFLEGFKLIYSNLKNNLNEAGVLEILAQDQAFNPEYMEAVFTEHVDGVEPGKVIDVLQKGYIYKDKVIRYAMVKVSE